MKYKRLFFCLTFFLTGFYLKPEVIPSVGAQVYIEPWHTSEQVDAYFRILHENQMTVCRLHLHEGYMHKPDGSWDFSLFDKAFEAARKYNIKVFATLAPLMNGNSFAYDEVHRKRINTYIEKIVSHFKDHRSLHAWVVYNEIGSDGKIPRTPLVDEQYENWQLQQAESENKGNSKTGNFTLKHFLVDLNTWYLAYLAGEVKKYDPDGHLHVNTHQIFKLVAEYDFPSWRKFMTSLGLSAHPSWHYGYFTREEYTLALSANCEIMRSGSATLPFWVTELQGGNNLYSGVYPFCPTKDEIIQWLWTSIGTGAEGSIFWCLNARSSGKEAGEWALLNFQDRPTDRLNAAGDVARCLNKNKSLFERSKALDTPVNILYVRESLWTEEFVQYGGDKKYEGRQTGGVIKSALAFYQVLLENGIKANLKEMNEFDWDKKDYTGICVILANQVSIPSCHWGKLEQFVARGGKLIVEGLTAFYNENMLSLHNTEFPLNRLFGGTLSEVICVPGDFSLSLEQLAMPAHLWKSYIFNESGNVIGKEGENITAIRHQYDKGSVVWIPSLIGLGAWRTKNKGSLSEFLVRELKEQTEQLPVYFSSHYDKITMQTLDAGSAYVTVIINKSERTENIKFTGKKIMPELLFSSGNGEIKGTDIMIGTEETMVVKWEKER